MKKKIVEEEEEKEEAVTTLCVCRVFLCASFLASVWVRTRRNPSSKYRPECVGQLCNNGLSDFARPKQHVAFFNTVESREVREALLAAHEFQPNLDDSFSATQRPFLCLLCASLQERSNRVWGVILPHGQDVHSASQ